MGGGKDGGKDQAPAADPDSIFKAAVADFQAGRLAEAEAALQSDGGRVLLRYSGTEPKVRLLLEGKDSDLLDLWSEKIIDSINAQIGVAD